jgi:hypothetical protein
VGWDPKLHGYQEYSLAASVSRDGRTSIEEGEIIEAETGVILQLTHHFNLKLTVKRVYD